MSSSRWFAKNRLVSRKIVELLMKNSEKNSVKIMEEFMTT